MFALCFSYPHRHKFVNNELIVKTGLVDKRKVSLHYGMNLF